MDPQFKFGQIRSRDFEVIGFKFGRVHFLQILAPLSGKNVGRTPKSFRVAKTVRTSSSAMPSFMGLVFRTRKGGILFCLFIYFVRQYITLLDSKDYEREIATLKRFELRNDFDTDRWTKVCIVVHPC